MSIAATDPTPTSYNLIITRGETYVRPFTWQTGSPLAPVNLTGYTARMQIRPDWLVPGTVPEASLVSLTDVGDPDVGIITLGGAFGTVVITITDDATSALIIDEGVYDLELVSAGKVTKFLRGKITVLPEATV